MPELPEVETTRRGIREPLLNARVVKVEIREPRLRWPIPALITSKLLQQPCCEISRRAKYLLLHFPVGTLLIHLGMSGRLSVIENNSPIKKHDHVDIHFDNGRCLRYTDPRRFGCILWTCDDPMQHKLLVKLGPEPLSDCFDSDYLFNASRGRKTTIKQFIMDGSMVVGVGNIYASEALYLAGILPARIAGSVSRKRYVRLVEAIKSTLNKAIAAGGTTLKDFLSADGKPGYFSQQLHVYGRDGEFCYQCDKKIVKTILGQRSTYYCRYCQR